jgi:hypothetical protein
LKKDSAGTSFRIVRVLPVADCQYKFSNERSRRLTLVALLLDFDLFGEVLVLLPLDVVADSRVVDKVTTVADLLLFGQ